MEFGELYERMQEADAPSHQRNMDNKRWRDQLKAAPPVKGRTDIPGLKARLAYWTRIVMNEPSQSGTLRRAINAQQEVWFHLERQGENIQEADEQPNLWGQELEDKWKGDREDQRYADSNPHAAELFAELKNSERRPARILKY